MAMDLFDTAPLDFTCPRCGLPASERFYGPCNSCRDAMRAPHDGEAREVEQSE